MCKHCHPMRLEVNTCCHGKRVTVHVISPLRLFKPDVLHMFNAFYNEIIDFNKIKSSTVSNKLSNKQYL